MKDDMYALEGYQRSYLKKEAHHKKPVVMLGQAGLSDDVIKAVEQALTSHELIKLKFQDFKADRKELSESLARETGAQFISLIGNILTLYRQNRNPKERIFKLPVH